MYAAHDVRVALRDGHERFPSEGFGVNARLRQFAFALAVMPGILAATADPMAAAAAGQQIAKGGSQPSATGPQAYFTGHVRVDPLWPDSFDSKTSAGQDAAGSIHSSAWLAPSKSTSTASCAACSTIVRTPLSRP